MIAFIVEFGQDSGATAALAATMTGKVDAAAMKNAGSSSGAGRVGGSEGVGGAVARDAKGHTASGNDTEEEDDPTDEAGAGGGAGAAKATRRKRNTQELEELARQEELESLRSEVQQYASTGEFFAIL